jgi:serine protease
MHVVPTQAGEPMAVTLARLRADPQVVYAEPDQRRYINAVPSDPLYLDQWYLQDASTTPSAIDATTTWEVTTGSNGVVIADIDTGVRFDHPDLLRAGAGDGGRLLPGYDFVSDPAAANDGNGWDPDPSDPGDWVTAADTNTSEFQGCLVADSSWHGTRVVGILGAITDNATGIAGLTWKSWILPVRALGKCGGNDSDIQAAMIWAAGIHVDGVPDNPYPAKIENLSIGGPGACTASYQDIIQQVTQLGVLIVVSAGNEGGPVSAAGELSRCGSRRWAAPGRHKGGLQQSRARNRARCAGGKLWHDGGRGSLPVRTRYDHEPWHHDTDDEQLHRPDQSKPRYELLCADRVGDRRADAGGERQSQLERAHSAFEGREPAFSAEISRSTISPPPPSCHVPTSATDVQDAECICTLDDMTCGAGMANASGAVAAALRPIAAVAVPTAVVAGGNIVLQAAGSEAACNHTITGYQWVSSDPTNHPVSSANAASTTVTAPTSGSFTVTLTVLDDAMPKRTDVATVIDLDRRGNHDRSSKRRTERLPECSCRGLAGHGFRVTEQREPASGYGDAGIQSDRHQHHQYGGELAGEQCARRQRDGRHDFASGVYTPPAAVSGDSGRDGDGGIGGRQDSKRLRRKSQSRRRVRAAAASIDALTLLAAVLLITRRTRGLRD